jgi:hypothetical protein
MKKSFFLAAICLLFAACSTNDLEVNNEIVNNNTEELVP